MAYIASKFIILVVDKSLHGLGMELMWRYSVASLIFMTTSL